MKRKITEEQKKQLVQKALEARKAAYVPYSGFRVGAALLTQDGEVFTGCNIENASFTPTVCAERTAVFKAVSEGHQEFAALAVTGGKGEEPPAAVCTPCGVCRQVLREFVEPEEFPIYLGKGDGTWEEVTLEDLLPRSFGKTNL